jgi:Na+/H+-dicarboxylate symporter
MTHNETKKPSLLGNLTVQILIAMLLGVILGIYIHNNYDFTFAKQFSDKIKILATVFIRLVQMIISPLVFTTLVVGIAKLGDVKTVGRVGGRALGWFFSASLISLLIGMFWVNLLQPGVGLNLSDVDLTSAAEVTGHTQNFSALNF